MNRQELIHQIYTKKSMLCVGLDTDANKLPSHLPKTTEGILTFNKAIIDATKTYAVSYKINTAFYEAHGKKGWEVMEKTLEHIPSNCFTIADAKRGDIGNTAEHYGIAFLQNLNFDSITIAPYMGMDSVAPFMTFENKWGIALGLTSNIGNQDIQKQLLANGESVSNHVMQLLADQFSDEQLMFVVGATNSEDIEKLRQKFPTYFFLVPGIGAQGGDLESVLKNGKINNEGGLLINVSRGIIFASQGEDYAFAARHEAKKYQQKMINYI